jgi:UPF0716 protein FxsA
MLAPRAILSLLRPEAARRLAYTFLAWALVPLAETILMVYLGGRLGLYLVLATAAALMLAGALVALARLREDIAELDQTVSEGRTPGRQLASIAGAVAALLLILSPGFASDVVGYLILFTRLRRSLGRALVRWSGIDAKEIYEYLRMSETLSARPTGVSPDARGSGSRNRSVRGS